MRIDIPGFGDLFLKHLLLDFTGTLSCKGKLIPGVAERINSLADLLEVHVLTGDTYGVVKKELAGVNCRVEIMSGTDITQQKQRYLQSIGAENVVAIGNGNNDTLMLKDVRLGIVVMEGEGCAVSALLNADIVARSITEAFDLLLHPTGCVATLRT